MFPPRWHGTAFNVSYTSEPSQKTPIKYHVITSLQSFDLITDDWRTSKATYHPSDIEKIEDRKGIIYVTLNVKDGNQERTLIMDPHPGKPDNLRQALTPVCSTPKPATRFLALANVLPTFKLLEKNLTMAINKYIMNQTEKLVEVFRNMNQYSTSQKSKERESTSGALVDAFTCLFRFRYNNEDAKNSETNVASLGIDVLRSFLAVWCHAISKAASEKSTDKKSKIFFSRLVVNCANTVFSIANYLKIPYDDLAQSVRDFETSGNSDGVCRAASDLANVAEDYVHQSIQTILPLDVRDMRVMMNATLMILSGVIVGIYQQDVEDLAEKLVNYTKAVMMRDKVRDATQELDKGIEKYRQEFLCFLDGARYDEKFQFVYCVWNLHNPKSQLRL